MGSRGLDFSDEGKYLLDTSTPNAASVNVTHYGYVYAPIFKLLDYNIVLFRFTNLVFTFLISSLTAFLIIQTMLRERLLDLIPKLLISSSLGYISLSFFLPYLLITPNYNSLTFQSLLLCSAFIYSLSRKKIDSIFSKDLFLLSGSFCLLFLAKPTSFVLLLIIFMTFTVMTRSVSGASILAFLLSLLLLLGISSFLIYGNILEIFVSVKGGFYATLSLTNSYGLLSQLTLLKIPHPQNWVFFTVVGLVLLLIVILTSGSQRLKRISFTMFLVMSLVYILNLNVINVVLGNFFLLFCTVIILYFLYSDGGKKSFSHLPPVILVILSMPIVGAIGTNNNLWIQSSMFFYFVFLSGFLLWLLEPEHTKFKLKTAIGLSLTLILTFSSLSTSVDNPYRQKTSLRESVIELSDNSRVDNLKVSKEVFLGVNGMYEELKKIGFKLNTPVIDFTGQSPTTIFLAGAFPLGDTWLLGGYEGSDQFALGKLSKIDCSLLSKAWLLIEEGGPRSLNHSRILTELGLELSDYLRAAKWDTPDGAGGYSEIRTQVLFEPKSSASACK